MARVSLLPIRSVLCRMELLEGSGGEGRVLACRVPRLEFLGEVVDTLTGAPADWLWRAAECDPG
jgi:hypothetical protein